MLDACTNGHTQPPKQLRDIAKACAGFAALSPRPPRAAPTADGGDDAGAAPAEGGASPAPVEGSVPSATAEGGASLATAEGGDLRVFACMSFLRSL